MSYTAETPFRFFQQETTESEVQVARARVLDPNNESQRPDGLGIISGNGVKVAQIEGIIRRVIGSSGKLEIIEGIPDIDERILTDKLRAEFPLIDIFDIPGYISRIKVLEAINRGNYNPASHPNILMVTNDTMRVVIDPYGHSELMGKPKNELEAVGQLKRLSGNHTIDIVGSTVIDSSSQMITFMVYLENEIHQIPDHIIQDIAANCDTHCVAGTLSILSRSMHPSGIEVMRSDTPTNIWTKILGEDDSKVGFFGQIRPGARINTRQLLNIICGGGYPFGLSLERMLDQRAGTLPTKVYQAGK